MNQRIFLILFVFLCMMLITPAEAKTWYVDDSGGADFTDIQSAINSASSSDTIYVYAGTYNSFEVSIPYLTIKGERPDLVTVNGRIDIPEIATYANATGTVLEGMKITEEPNIDSDIGTVSDVTIRDCIFNGLTWSKGIDVDCDNLTFENNIVSNSTGKYAGMSIEKSNVLISNNTFSNNKGAGLTLYSKAINTTVTKNIFSSNAYAGIEFYKTTGLNTIYLNNFISNGVPATTSGTTAPALTHWNSTTPIKYIYNSQTYTGYVGNYWSDYNGTDANGDGIGDTPYVLPDSLGNDNYPLMQPFENYAIGGGGESGGDAPVANFTANVTSGTAPLTVQFTDESTNTPTSWSWDFDNDGNVDSIDQNPVHTYTAAGNYTVNLTVSNVDGSDSKVKTEYIVVSEPLSKAPVANFTATPTSGSAPLTVNFTDQSTGSPTSWLWDFGDDTNATEQNPSHIYSTAGTYDVNLTVSNADGRDSEVKTEYITVTSAATNDLSISGIVNTVPGSAVFAKEPNTIKVTNVMNTGTASLTNISVAFYASDVSNGTVPVNTTTISSLAGGAKTTVSLIDPTIRNLEDGTVTYTSVVDPDNLIPETNEENNNKSSSAKPLRYNGYKGKGIYWEGESNITTKHTYDLQGNLLYSTQPDTSYKAVGWTGRTEIWTADDLPIPSGSTIEKAFLYFAYNWDQTPGGYPWLNLNFNGNTIENGNLSTGDGTLYRDWSNFGGYADYEYGLCVYDVTDKFNETGNSLVTSPYGSSYNKVALYPSTLVVIYRDSNETRKQIFINEECDELGVSMSSYGTTSEEATAYAPFTGMSIDKSKVTNATMYSFAGSAGPDEGNLLFNGNTVAPLAWQGSSNSASPLVFNVKNYINETENEAGIQGTTSGGMDALQQILVVEYQKEQEAAPVANFTANVTSGTAPLDVQFTDASTGSPTSWLWDFGDGTNSTEQNPLHTYNEVGNYTVNLKVTNAAGSNSSQLADLIKVTEPPTSTEQPDLIVSAIIPNADEFFANETNNISAKVENVGTNASGSFTVTFTVNSIDTNVTVDALEAGTNTTVTITDPTIRSFGDNVTVTAAADSGNEIAESSEINNQMNITKSVVYNGYKGKRYTGGNDLGTQVTFEGKYGLVYSYGNTAYASGSWTAKTYTWSSTDLPIPAGATVESARLYQPYTWNKMTNDPAFTMSFNNNTVTPIATYKDRKSYGSYDYPSGLYVYNVTSLFDPAGNSITINPETGNNYGIYGAYLVVVYNDLTATEKKIWINDEFDLLASKGSYAVSNEEATAYASFSDVNATGISKATAIAVLASGNDNNKSKFVFNDNEYTGFWPDYQTMPQIGFSSYNVTGALLTGMDTARVQSYDNGTGGDSMSAMNVILVADYGETQNGTGAPVAAFTANLTSGDAPLTVNFTDESTSTPTSWAWDFDNNGTVDSTEQNPIYTYTSAGNYTVNLTVANADGSDSEVKTDYIVVSEPLPGALVANFTANVTSGKAPLTVEFTDISTGSPTSWQWDFNNDGTVDSTEQNPIYTYAATGTYTVNLTVTGPDGNDSEVKTGYINVTSPSSAKPVAAFSAFPTSGKTPLNVKFTDTSTGSPTSWFWNFGDGSKSYLQNPIHKYSKAGVYTVNLTVKNAAGRNTVTKTDYIKVITKPVANFTSSATSGKAPLKVTFTDTSTGSPTSWKWDFGDGSKSFHQNPIHKYSKAGTYTVNLTVKNAIGRNTVTKTSYIKVITKPVANFTSSVTSGKAPLKVAFTDTSTGIPAAWKWDFGDGSKSYLQNPTHKYSKVGSYTVNLTVKNAKGRNTVTKTEYIKVVTKPVADFSATPTSGKTPLTVEFTDNSTGVPTAWKWSFGDGTTSTEQNPEHQYLQGGSYKVTLTVVNVAGSSTVTKKNYIKVTTNTRPGIYSENK